MPNELSKIGQPEQPSQPGRADAGLVDALRAVLREELGGVSRELTALAAVRDDVLTLDGAARLLDVCSKTVLTWHRDRGLPAHRVGAVWRFLRSELVVWVEAQGGHHVQ